VDNTAGIERAGCSAAAPALGLGATRAGSRRARCARPRRGCASRESRAREYPACGFRQPSVALSRALLELSLRLIVALSRVPKVPNLGEPGDSPNGVRPL